MLAAEPWTEACYASHGVLTAELVVLNVALSQSSRNLTKLMWILAILRFHSLLSAKWTSYQGSGSLIMCLRCILNLISLTYFHRSHVELHDEILLTNGHSYPSWWHHFDFFAFLLYPVQLCNGPLTFNIQEVLHVRLWPGPSVHQHYWGSPTSKYIPKSVFPFLQLIRNGKVLWFCLLCCCAWPLYWTAFSARWEAASDVSWVGYLRRNDRFCLKRCVAFFFFFYFL